MESKTLELAKRAGFVFWDNEHWIPENQAIDWSSDYDLQLEEFKRLVVQDTCYVLQDLVIHRVPASQYSEKIKQYWKITA